MWEWGEMLEQVAQRAYGCPISGSVQNQVVVKVSLSVAEGLDLEDL